MNKKLLSIVVIIIAVGAVAGYLLIFKNGGSLPFSSSKVPSDWQVYESKEYGFTIKYPPNYVLTDQKEPGEHIISFGPEQKGEDMRGQMMVIITEKSYGESIEEFRKTTAGKLQERPRNVGGINGVEFKGKPDPQMSGIWILIPYKDRALAFITIASNLENESTQRFDIFVSSFVP